MSSNAQLEKLAHLERQVDELVALTKVLGKGKPRVAGATEELVGRAGQADRKE